MGLVGKFIFHMGEEYSRHGEIIDQISDEIVLIRFDHGCIECECGNRAKRIVPISIKSLMIEINDYDDACELFETRADLDAFLQWLETPSENKCAHGFCRASLRHGYHADHVIPLDLGGSNDRRNIQLLCPPCNMRKGPKDPIVWAQENGHLL